VRFSNSVVIRRSPGEVFAFLADPANVPKWNAAITSTRPLSQGPLGVGTRLAQTRSIPRPAIEELEVTEFVPDRRMVLQGDVGPLTGTLSYEIEVVPEGTRLTNTADLTGRGPLLVLSPLATGRVREAVATNLENLRQLLESSA
jgi:uncharacterized protein YndB with AHSA1/START domain